MAHGPKILNIHSRKFEAWLIGEEALYVECSIIEHIQFLVPRLNATRHSFAPWESTATLLQQVAVLVPRRALRVPRSSRRWLRWLRQVPDRPPIAREYLMRPPVEEWVHTVDAIVACVLHERSRL